MRAAGVLPYNREHGFLLGRETSNGLWADFGGMCDRGESPQVCAAREFCEETMGILMDHQTAVEALDDAPYHQRDDRYRMYLLEIPYSKHLVSEFKKRYRQLKRLHVDSSYLEKDQARWFTVAQLKRDRHRLRPEFLATYDSMRACKSCGTSD